MNTNPSKSSVNASLNHHSRNMGYLVAAILFILLFALNMQLRASWLKENRTGIQQNTDSAGSVKKQSDEKFSCLKPAGYLPNK